MDANEELLADLKMLGQRWAELAAIFRNQQRFIHLYALARGAQVNVGSVTDLLRALDAGRSVSPQTYYATRRELNSAGWIDFAAEGKDPHRVKTARLGKFQELVVKLSLVQRPATIDKYHLF